MKTQTGPSKTETGPTVQQELRVAADQLVSTVRELVHEGNVRRVIVRNEAGDTLLEIPLTVGVVGALVLPVAAALGALAAVATGLVIVVERVPAAQARAGKPKAKTEAKAKPKAAARRTAD